MQYKLDSIIVPVGKKMGLWSEDRCFLGTHYFGEKPIEVQGLKKDAK
jgi:hypothetical protein